MGQDDGEMDRNSPEFQAALRDHAKTLGVNPDTEPLLMALVEEALLAALPEGWEQGTTDDGALYYFNTNTEESIWEHPLDAHYRSLIQAKKISAKEPNASNTTTDAKSSPSTTTGKPPQQQQQPPPQETKASNVHVYSFDDFSDDDDPNIQPKEVNQQKPGRTGLSGAIPNASATGSTTSMTSLTSTSLKTEQSSLKATSTTSVTTAAAVTKPAATFSPIAASSTSSSSSAFGRDRSWLLDDDDTVPSSFGSNKPGSTSTPTPAPAPTSTAGPYGSNKTSPNAPSTALTPAQKDEDSKNWFTSRLFANEVEVITPVKSDKPAIPTPAPAVVPTPSRYSSPVSTTPIGTSTGSSLTSVVDKPFSAMTSHTTSTATASTIPAATATMTTNPQLADLKKTNDELQKTVTSLQGQLEKALNEAKEVHYLKMKITEHKTKLGEYEQKEKELLKNLQHAEQQTQKLQQVVLQLELTQKENDSRVSSQFAAKTTEQQKLHDEHQKILDKCSSLQSQLDQQLAKEKLLTESLEKTHREHLSATNVLKDQISSLEIQLDNLKKDLSLSNQQLDRHHEQFDKEKKLWQASEHTLEKQLEASEKAKSQVESIVDQLRKQIESVNSSQQDQLEQVRHFQNQIHQLDREKQLMQSELSQRENQQEVSRKRLDEAQKQLDELTKQLLLQQQQHQSQHQKLLHEYNQLVTENQTLKTTELFNLQNQLESLQKEKKAWQDTERKLHHELQTCQQNVVVSQDQFQQNQLECDLWKRKYQQEKQYKELCVADKAQSDQKVLLLEAEVASWQHSTKLDSDKQKFRLQELESQMAQKEYEALRAQEKFQKAEAWRQKENKRVEQRDLEILQLREELVQLKSRNLEMENTVVIQNLRKANENLEASQHKLKAELETSQSQYAQKLLLLQQQHDSLKQQMELQIPQLAAIAVNRTSEEWAKKCHVLTRKLQQQYQLKSLEENKATLIKWNALLDEKKNWEQKCKQNVAESDFLRKEVQRLEENNKVLLDQLHTIRCYLTQRPLHGSGFNFDYGNPSGSAGGNPARNQPSAYSYGWTPPPPTGAGLFSNNSQCSSEFLSNQLGILHAHFQKLFGDSSFSTTSRPCSTKDTTFGSGLGIGGSFVNCDGSGLSSTLDHSDRFEIPCASPTNGKSSTSSAAQQVYGAMLDQALDTRLAQQTSTENATNHLLETLDKVRASASALPTSCSAAAVAMAVGDGGVPGGEFGCQEVPNPSIWYQKDYWRTKYQQPIG